MSRLLRFNDHPVTPQRITASNWLLKLEIASHIHYLTSACVITVINKAWHLPFASFKVCRKIYPRLEKAIHRPSAVWAIMRDPKRISPHEHEHGNESHSALTVVYFGCFCVDRISNKYWLNCIWLVINIKFGFDINSGVFFSNGEVLLA